jgi:Flp pilus assembly protein TadG
MTAGGMVALLVVAALVVDMGYAKQMRREAQASADAAALAAAQVMAGGGTYAAAATAARDIADTNLKALDGSGWAGCTDPDRPDNYEVVDGTGGLTGGCVSFDTTAHLVRVVLPTVDAPSFFGHVVDRDQYAVGATASAVWEEGSSGTGACGICGIDGAEFQQAGNGNVKIDGGRQIQADRLRINSNNNANEPKELGWYLSDDSNNKHYEYTQLSAPVANPFASVTVDYTNVKMSAVMNATCADLRPNEMYPQTVNINSSCTLQYPGVYYFKNGISVSGTLKGDHVTLVMGCATGTEKTDTPRTCNGDHTGNVNISGGMDLGAPYYEGMSLLWDETASAESVINYNGHIKLGGAYYSRSATPAFQGGTFVATAVVFGGDHTATMNGGNIHIVDPSGGGGGAGGGTVGLWR